MEATQEANDKLHDLIVLFHTLILSLSKYILKCCNESWNQPIDNKLHEITPVVDKTCCSYGQYVKLIQELFRHFINNAQTHTV